MRLYGGHFGCRHFFCFSKKQKKVFSNSPSVKTRQARQEERNSSMYTHTINNKVVRVNDDEIGNLTAEGHTITLSH